MEGSDDLSAQLDQAAVRQPGLLDPATGSRAGLEHDHVRAAERQVPRCAQAGEAGAEHGDVVSHSGASQRTW